MTKLFVPGLLILGLLLAAAKGCESDDARVATLSQEAAVRQADQNREMARLVESQQSLQKGLDDQRGHLDRQRTELEDERRAFAAQRVRDPILANALVGAVILAACILPLVLALYVLRSAHRSESDDVALGELLVHELVAEDSLLLPPPAPAALEQQPAPRKIAGEQARDF